MAKTSKKNNTVAKKVRKLGRSLERREHVVERSLYFYHLCYDQYKLELQEADKLYQKGIIMLLVLPILGTVVARLGRIDLIGEMFVRVDVFLYYLFLCSAFFFFVVSVVYTVLCVCPRSDYKRLGAIIKWKKWREDYEKYLSDKPDSEKSVDDAMVEKICSNLAEAQTVNAPLNEKRRRHFKKSVQTVALGLISVLSAGLFYLLLRIQGV